MIREVKLLGRSVRMNLRSDADESVFEEVFVDRDYKVLDEALKEADVIWDVGAHIGCFSIYASLLNPEARILAFEPEPENFTALKENLKLNRVNNVTSKNVAVAAKAGERDLFIAEDSHNHSLEGAGEFVKVRAVELRGGCDVLKMDCEGAEFEILPSMLESGVLDQVKNIYLEYHAEPAVLIEILKKAGFIVRRFPSHYDKSMGFLFGERG